MSDTLPQPSITTHGDVGDRAKAYVEEKLVRVAKLAQGPILGARVVLRMETNPAVQRPAVAEATIDVNGHAIRAHVAAASMLGAIDLLEERLGRQLRQLAERRRAKRERKGEAEPGEWHHGDLPTRRPSHFPRPPEERELRRQKSFAAVESTPDEAVFDMDMLDHDFYLFTNITTEEDNVVHRLGDGAYELLAPTPDPGAVAGCVMPLVVSEQAVPRVGVTDAVALLDVSAEPFVFFVDVESGRGAVVYLRYDGHYGLLTTT